MERKKILSVLAIAALGVVMASPAAQAGVTEFDANGSASGNWSVSTNWTNGLPGSDDRAVIQSGKTCSFDLSSATVGTLQVDGTLIILANKTLTIDGASINPTHSDDSEVDGNLYLNGSESCLTFTSIDQTMHGDNDGEIAGKANDARIKIDDVTLTNSITMSGQMSIERLSGSARFCNGSTGVVRAGNPNASGSDEILSLASNLTVIDDSDRSTASWEVTDPDGILQFNEAATGLVGNFIVDNCGTLDVNADITTTGSLTQTAGTVDASPGPGSPCFDWNGAGFPTKICGTTTTGGC